MPIATTIGVYRIELSKSLTTSITIGIVPIAAFFGAIVAHFALKCMNRRTGFYIAAVINLIAIILVNITYFSLLIVGRWIEGMCVGFYVAVAPIYLREVAPKELRRKIGLFFSLLKVVGVLYVIVLELVMTA